MFIAGAFTSCTKVAQNSGKNISLTQQSHIHLCFKTLRSLTQNESLDLNVKHRTIQLLEENRTKKEIFETLDSYAKIS